MSIISAPGVPVSGAPGSWLVFPLVLALALDPLAKEKNDRDSAVGAL